MEHKRLRMYLRLLVRPIFVGLLTSCVWYGLFFVLGLHFLEADESAFTDSIIPTLAMFHAIVAGNILTKVWDRQKMVAHCVRTKNEEAFRQCIDDKIPGVIHLLLGSMSIIIQSLVMLIHFVGPFGGIVSNFSVAFVLLLYWEVATDLDDPTNGAWYVDQIPKEWLTPKS